MEGDIKSEVVLPGILTRFLMGFMTFLVERKASLVLNQASSSSAPGFAPEF